MTNPSVTNPKPSNITPFPKKQQNSVYKNIDPQRLQGFLTSWAGVPTAKIGSKNRNAKVSITVIARVHTPAFYPTEDASR